MFWEKLPVEDRILWMRLFRHIVERLGGSVRSYRYSPLG